MTDYNSNELSESIIVDPSFFVMKNGLKKLQAFEEEYAREVYNSQRLN